MLTALIKTVRPEIQIIYLINIATGIAIAGTVNADWVRIAIGTVSLMLAYFGIYAINALADEEIDRINKPDRPLVRGEIKRHELKVFTVLCFAAGLIGATALDTEMLILTAALATLGIIYSVKPVHLKSRGLLNTLTVVIGHSAAVLGGGLLAGMDGIIIYQVIAIQSMIAFLVAFSKDLPDVKGDSKKGIKTLAIQLGERNSIRLMHILPLLPLLYLALEQTRLAGILLAAVFYWSIQPLKEKKFMDAFMRGVKSTIFQNLLLIAIFALS
ncbi:MAG: UbiA prenyltransferase family protein [Candidatus Aenigmarchaeota archaeon]|nr:UbiA prenyltransferase family protein [Candidatus Aenigmarchaeota archaeon]